MLMDKEALAGVLGITDDSIVKCNLWELLNPLIEIPNVASA